MKRTFLPPLIRPKTAHLVFLASAKAGSRLRFRLKRLVGVPGHPKPWINPAHSRAWSICLIGGVLSGCGGNHVTDLEEHIKVKEAEFRQKDIVIEPLPEILPIESVNFEPVGRLDPFVLPEQPLDTEGGVIGRSLRPDVGRPREELESFPLDTLRMVGTMERDNVLYGLIRNKEGAVFRVKSGNYIGQNFGKIVRITETEIEVNELIPDGIGGWIERQASLALAGI